MENLHGIGGAGMLILQKINYSYDTRTKALFNVSVKISQGTIVAIAGRNGSGKTTLTRVLMGILSSNSGAIIFEGKAMSGAGPADMAKFVGYVFQNPDRQIFANSVWEEVAYAPKQLGFSEAETDRSVGEALAAVGLSGWEETSPQILSQGIKQRLSIASALAARPKILILDEPTTGQDCRERTILLSLMRKLNREGMTILLVTHDMDIIAEHANQLIVLEKGCVEFDGAPRELFSDAARTLRLGLELPEAVKIGRELGLGMCLTPQIIYQKLEERECKNV